MSERVEAILAKPDADLVGEIEALVRKAVNLVSDGNDAAAVVDEINRLTGRNYAQRDFFEMWGWTDERQFAVAAAHAPAGPIGNLSRDELLDILGYLSRGEEPQTTVLIDLLERSFPGVFDTGLIYYPHRDMTDEEVVDELFHRKELVREGGPEALRTYLLQLAQEVLSDPNAKVYSKMWAKGVGGRS